jgi:hypothetical protein
MRRNLWIIGGTICVGLGVIGIVLPILPTTPFLLLAAFCYTRGSGRFYDWLVNRSHLGGYIRTYQEGRGIPIKQKLLTISALWLTIGLTISFAAETWWLIVLLAVVVVGVTIHLIKIKTLQQEPVGLASQANSSEPVEAS